MRHRVRNRWIRIVKGHAGYGEKRRTCNLCDYKFAPHSIFDRYCKTCREENELLRFYEWLPELEVGSQAKLPA